MSIYTNKNLDLLAGSYASASPLDVGLVIDSSTGRMGYGTFNPSVGLDFQGESAAFGSLSVGGTITSNGNAVLTGHEAAPWFRGNTQQFGQLTSGGYGMESRFYDNGGSSFNRSMMRRYGGVWDWQHKAGGGYVRTPMRLPFVRLLRGEFLSPQPF